MNKTLLFAAVFWLSGSFLFAEEPKAPVKLLNVGVGIYDIIHDPSNALIQLEYRSFLPDFHYLRPLAGIMATNRATVYLYGGISGDIFLGKYFVLTPSFAPGLYFKGNGKDLGFIIEFRSAMEFAYVLPSQGRIGAQFYHLSNASFGSKNPGSESLVFFYSIPL